MKYKSTPLYQVISDIFREKIKTGDFSYDIPLCTEKSVCEQYKVSRITAKRVMEELEKEGLLYRRRGIGSFVVADDQKSDLITHVVHNGGTSYRVIALMIPSCIAIGGIFRVVGNLSSALALVGCCLTLNVYEPGLENEEAMLRQLLANHVDGVVYYPMSSDLPILALDAFYRAGKPIITIDKPHDFQQYSSVVCDNTRGAYLLTEHLLAYGHRNICYLSMRSREEVSSIYDRYAGFELCLQENDEPAKPRFIKIDTHPNVPFDYSMLKHLINGLYKEGVTAIECENDEVAFYAHMCCRSLSLSMPKNLSLTGFDNSDWAVTGNANITTINQDFEQIGKEIASILLQPQYEPVHRVVPVSLIPRLSTGPVPV